MRRSTKLYPTSCQVCQLLCFISGSSCSPKKKSPPFRIWHMHTIFTWNSNSARVCVKWRPPQWKVTCQDIFSETQLPTKCRLYCWKNKSKCIEIHVRLWLADRNRSASSFLWILVHQRRKIREMRGVSWNFWFVIEFSSMNVNDVFMVHRDYEVNRISANKFTKYYRTFGASCISQIYISPLDRESSSSPLDPTNILSRNNLLHISFRLNW